MLQIYVGWIQSHAKFSKIAPLLIWSFIYKLFICNFNFFSSTCMRGVSSL